MSAEYTDDLLARGLAANERAARNNIYADGYRRGCEEAQRDLSVPARASKSRQMLPEMAPQDGQNLLSDWGIRGFIYGYLDTISKTGLPAWKG